jgi:hypothetical protein
MLARGMARRWRTIARIGAGIALLLTLQGCIVFPLNGFRSLRVARDRGVPVVEVVINAAGGDAVSVETQGDDPERIRLAEAAAGALGASGYFATEDLFRPNTAVVRLNRRLVSPSEDRWTLRFETGQITTAMLAEGYRSYDLYVCHPSVEARFDASRSPDLPAFGHCRQGEGWSIGGDDLLIGIELEPKSSHYFVFLAAVLLASVVLSALAWVSVDRLRRGPFRRRTAASIALGVVAGILVAGIDAGTVANIGATLGPAHNLALTRDLGLAALVGVVAAPAAVAAVPGLIVAALLLRKRPWGEEEVPAEWKPWPEPPPPGSTTAAPPPPPMPWQR